MGKKKASHFLPSSSWVGLLTREVFCIRNGAVGQQDRFLSIRRNEAITPPGFKLKIIPKPPCLVLATLPTPFSDAPLTLFSDVSSCNSLSLSVGYVLWDP